MSRGFVKDGDQEEVPMVPPRAFLPQGMVNYVTIDGMNALTAEKEHLIRERDNTSGNETDKRVTHNFINSKLKLLEERICTAVVQDPASMPKGVVCFGCWVSLRIEKEDSIKILHITGADESDAVKGFITYYSPFAKAINGHKEGDAVTIPLPSGEQTVTILKISSSPIKSESPKKHIRDKSPNSALKNPHPKHVNTCSEDNSPEVPAAPTTAPRDNANEIFPIMNERGITVGRAARWQCHNGSKLLHPVVHLYVFNSKGELYLQKRPSWKDIQPGKWDISVGGHVGFGESIDNALRRETKEELGIEDFTPVFIKRFVFESPIEKELVHSFRTLYDGPIFPSQELDGGRFWSQKEILEQMGKKIFTPAFESEYSSLSLSGNATSPK